MEKVISGVNDLKTWCENNNRNDLLKEWDYVNNKQLKNKLGNELSSPELVMPKAGLKVNWICNKGHHYMASIESRTAMNSGCPYCSNRLTLQGYNDFQTWCRENDREKLLAEWDYEKNSILPTQISPFNSKKIWWICDKNHHYLTSIGNRTAMNSGCPYCSNRLTLQGYNDLETWCKNNNRVDLLREWDYEKNSILPTQISPFNSKKVWWKCSLGHSFDAVVSSRTHVRKDRNKKTSGCPYCSNPPKKILVGFNDFESWCKNNHKEELLEEWDREANNILPTEVSYGSGKQIWWKCKKNHKWKTAVSQRATGWKTGCPICSRTQTSFPEQTLAFYLGKKYHILQRYRIKGKEVDVFIPEYNIAVEYDGMMWHSDEDKQLQDLEKTKVLFEDGISLIRLKESKTISSVYYSNNQYIIKYIVNGGKYITKNFEAAIIELFKIINNISKNDSIPSIDIMRDELLIRAHYMNILKENSVAIVFPELVKEWDIEKNEGITPDAFSARNNKKIWWKCSEGHSWLASINSRGVRKLGCPFCAGQRVIKGENDFKTWCTENKPLLLQEWNYEKNTLQPDEIPRTYKEKIWWRCSNGHEWEATAYNRINGTGCPKCNNGKSGARNKISLAEWCIENKTNLCEEWNYEKNGDITPENITHGSHKKVWWICPNGHEWEAQIKSRTYNHGCPFCSSTNKKAIIGVNDLKTWCKQNEKQYILEEWDYENNGDLCPEMFTSGSHKRVKWKCKNGHSWEAVIKERTKINGNRCPICYKK